MREQGSHDVFKHKDSFFPHCANAGIRKGGKLSALVATAAFHRCADTVGGASAGGESAAGQTDGNAGLTRQTFPFGFRVSSTARLAALFRLLLSCHPPRLRHFLFLREKEITEHSRTHHFPGPPLPIERREKLPSRRPLHRLASSATTGAMTATWTAVNETLIADAERGDRSMCGF